MEFRLGGAACEAALAGLGCLGVAGTRQALEICASLNRSDIVYCFI
jgi:hypothetical protein